MNHLKLKCLIMYLCVYKWLIFDAIVSSIQQYLKQFNFTDLYYIKLLEIELLDHSAACNWKMSLQIIYLIYMLKKDLALNNLQWLICHKTEPNRWFIKIVVSKNGMNVHDGHQKQWLASNYLFSGN